MTEYSRGHVLGHIKQTSSYFGVLDENITIHLMCCIMLLCLQAFLDYSSKEYF